MLPLSDLRTAAYCPRQLYYRRREDDRDPPATVAGRRALAHRYPDLVEASRARLSELPIAVDPGEFRRRLRWLRVTGQEPPDDADPPSPGRTSERWRRLTDPADRDVLVEGRDCRGVVQKLLVEPPEPVLVSAGAPPERGVWEPQSVWAVGAALALAHERETGVERATVEYPAHGIVRRVRVTAGRRARYRETLRTVRSMDGPPPRAASEQRCAACEYAEQCGVRTRTLRSLLGLD